MHHREIVQHDNVASFPPKPSSACPAHITNVLQLRGLKLRSIAITGVKGIVIIRDVEVCKIGMNLEVGGVVAKGLVEPHQPARVGVGSEGGKGVPVL